MRSKLILVLVMTAVVALGCESDEDENGFPWDRTDVSYGPDSGGHHPGPAPDALGQDTPPATPDAGESDACVPDCLGRVCGPDGCGGECGLPCQEGYICNDDGMCVSCTPDCEGLDCGPDPICGFSCGDCPPDAECIGGECVSEGVARQCTDAELIAFENCADLCQDQACLQNCFSTHLSPDCQTAYNAFAACAQAAGCGDNDMACFQANCPDELAALIGGSGPAPDPGERQCNDSELMAFNNCAQPCEDQPCLQNCFSTHLSPTCQAAYNALGSCAQNAGCPAGDDGTCAQPACPDEWAAVFG